MKGGSFVLPVSLVLKGDLAMNAWLTVRYFTPRVDSAQQNTAGQPSLDANNHVRAGAQTSLLAVFEAIMANPGSKH